MQAMIYPPFLPTDSQQGSFSQPNCSSMSMKIALLAAIVRCRVINHSRALGGIISLAIPIVPVKLVIAVTTLLILRQLISIKDSHWEQLPIESLEQKLEKEIPHDSEANKPVNNQDPLNTVERYALQYWSSNHYTKMNVVAAREKTCWRVMDSLLNMHTRCINRIAIHALSKLPPFPNNKLLYRGAKLPERAINRLYQVGKVYHLDRFMSTSATKGSHFAGNVTYHVYGKMGKNIQDYSLYYQEAEVLFVPGSKFYISKMEKFGDQTTVEMNEV